MAEASHAVLYQCLFAESNDAFFIFRPDDLQILEANPTAQRLTGMRRKALVGLKLSDLITEEEDGVLSKLVDACRKTSFFHAREGYGLRRDDDGRLAVNVSISRIHVEPEPLGLAVIRDVTQRKEAEGLARQLQSELARLCRIASVGEMAAVLAHEVNQPLCGIVNDANTCKRIIASGSADMGELARVLEEISGAALRASEIVERLRGFVAKRGFQQSVQNVNDLVSEIVAMAEPDARSHKVALRLDLCESPANACVDGIQIQQVLVNLLRNAIEALQGIDPAERRVDIRTSVSDDGIRVDVADNGPGIANGDAEKLFEPYYTTKSEGLGIGLSLSRTIINQHRGRLFAAGRRERGAMFSFTLPRESQDHLHDIP